MERWEELQVIKDLRKESPTRFQIIKISARVTVPDELEREFRKVTAEKFGHNLQIAIIEAIEEWIATKSLKR